MEAAVQQAAAANLIPLVDLAGQTGLPVAWLRKQTKDGFLPGLRVGGRVLYNIQAVRDAVALAATNPVTPAKPRAARRPAPAPVAAAASAAS